MATWHTNLRKIWRKMEGMPENRRELAEREQIAPKFDQGVALMKELGRALSGTGSMNAELVAGMLSEFAKEHPTNQQSIVRSLVTMLQNWVCDINTGEVMPDHDPRREQSWQFAERLVRDDTSFIYM